MEQPLLNDPQLFPSNEVLEKILCETYPVYEELIKTITQSDFGLDPVWNYYKDGKAWLCKVCFKKKTVFWLSVWNKLFKTTFYFTEKNSEAISNLKIDTNLKENFFQAKHIGKLIPLTIELNNKGKIMDLIRIIEYKKSLK
jgi:hypothetical protein